MQANWYSKVMEDIDVSSILVHKSTSTLQMFLGGALSPNGESKRYSGRRGKVQLSSGTNIRLFLPQVINVDWVDRWHIANSRY